MKKDKIEAILKQKTKDLYDLSSKISPYFGVEQIHKFRVEIKRLRSFMHLINTEAERALHIPKKTKKLYEIAGIIREAQIEKLYIKRCKLNCSIYTEHLKLIIDSAKSDWKAQDIEKVILALRKEAANDVPKKLHPQSIIIFFEDKLKKIRATAKGNISNEDIHTCRKLIKDMLYNAKLAEKEWEGGYKSIQTFRIPEMDKISDALGKYNDERIILDHIDTYLKKPKNKKDVINNLAKSKQQQLAITRKEVILQLKSFSLR